MQITRRKDLPSFSPGKGNPIITPFVGDADTNVAMFELYIPRGVTAPPHTHAGSTLALHIVSGTITVLDGDTRHRLAPGHSVLVAADEKIGLENKNDEPVRIIAAVGPGTFLGNVRSLPEVDKKDRPNISYGSWID
ncbi:cupin domain-containing protein [Actinotignum urinale]|uniref:Cupin domain-containing protein n=1 Tax=Actinotignum urinale TaxID=190146 RepID=A0AAW9HX65_9ACTO|nr:cupin domain-containing protein [Actinotignum urinale]MDY5129308.1 cupin domain-containing protein [Actinotignum urinale]MDY5133254.1 cupin domain-containing protein [Actinotignum urinale]MDY5151704.1 cupin domain-containing protein [Actinotignum urinale]MDY5154406.1 cupin domain-containing protein [Actinotignum urinale]MDY5160422.1 cupin domain-containing protein [Actinotignum urinale]